MLPSFYVHGSCFSSGSINEDDDDFDDEEEDDLNDEEIAQLVQSGVVAGLRVGQSKGGAQRSDSSSSQEGTISAPAGRDAKSSRKSSAQVAPELSDLVNYFQVTTT